MNILDYRIPEYNFETYNLTFGLSKESADKCRTLLERGVIGKPHVLFAAEAECTSSMEAMHKYDPLLALLCSLSYRYQLHPIYQLGLSHVDVSRKLLQFGGDNTYLFGSQELKIAEQEWVTLSSYLKGLYRRQPLFLYGESSNPSLELQDRWEVIKLRLIQEGVITSGVSLFSYYTTGIAFNFIDFKASLSIQSYAEIGLEDYVELTLRSCGLDADYHCDLIYFTPPDPFADII